MLPRLSAAAEALDRGELVVYPTDTLLGLGAKASDDTAVARLMRAKDRPAGMPISIAVSSVAELESIARLTPSAASIVRRSLPGPFTFLVPISPRARDTVAAPLVGPAGAVGIRVPDHPVAREIARRVGAITCTSANRHGRPACRNVGEARREFGDIVRVYVASGPAPSGSPSTLVDLTGASPRVVTRGATVP
jgi:L-threonylcarbamoyladenylate synthase